MNKLITFVGYILLLLALLINIAFAQTSGSQKKDNYPRVLSDTAVNTRLQNDWDKRNSNIQNQLVQWYELGDGYYGAYNIDNDKYMTLYDANGDYVQTLRRSEWSKVPGPIKLSYEASPHKKQKVSSYWEVSDPNMKGYYVEYTDDHGKNVRLYANEKGEFSTAVPKAKAKH